MDSPAVVKLVRDTNASPLRLNATRSFDTSDDGRGEGELTAQGQGWRLLVVRQLLNSKIKAQSPKHEWAWEPLPCRCRPRYLITEWHDPSEVSAPSPGLDASSPARNLVGSITTCMEEFLEDAVVVLETPFM
ncbi:hypothetical protein SAMD00023353_4700220 [Rosellinia necatrix]|uniref:Uncharacterized protein n=1 Tax=Rosellinia necatrix TaxID=77044 RepID=A0A1S8A9E2_ROSNE|nr:hypothetical protein SAMD00023353_4700220 [Rosellinia necatrix]